MKIISAQRYFLGSYNIWYTRNIFRNEWKMSAWKKMKHKNVVFVWYFMFKSSLQPFAMWPHSIHFPLSLSSDNLFIFFPAIFFSIYFRTGSNVWGHTKYRGERSRERLGNIFTYSFSITILQEVIINRKTTNFCHAIKASVDTPVSFLGSGGGVSVLPGFVPKRPCFVHGARNTTTNEEMNKKKDHCLHIGFNHFRLWKND